MITGPVSRDPALPYGDPIRAPSEPKEKLNGPPIFVLDQGSRSVYEFDSVRGRFLGPHLRLDDKTFNRTGHNALPGYPTIVSSQPPQGLAVVGSYVAVAGGTEGKIAIVPWSRDEGLGEPEFVDIPIIGEPDATKDDATRTATDVVWVTRFGENSVVAVTTNALFKEYIGPNPAEEVSAGSWPYKSTAYVIDLTSRKITKTGAISDLAVQSVASYGDGFVAASGGQVVVVQADLTISRRFPLAGAGRMAVVGDKAIIESGKYTPAAGEKPLVAGDGHVRLVGLDLHTGGTFEITSTPTGGAFAASVTDIWWAYGAGRRPNTLKHIWGGNVTENSGDFKVEERPMRAPRAGRKGDCVDVRALVRFLENVYATCSSYDKLAIVPIDGGPIAIHDAGGFPVDIATP